MNENVNKPSKRGKWGRNPKTDKADNCVMVRFCDTEFARFLTMFEESGVNAKAVFIKARVFNDEFRVIKIDRSAMEYATKLTSFYAQFRAIGVNYNQVVKELHSNFSEKKALALLYKLEKITVELVGLSRKIISLSEDFRENYLKEKEIKDNTGTFVK